MWHIYPPIRRWMLDIFLRMKNTQNDRGVVLQDDAENITEWIRKQRGSFKETFQISGTSYKERRLGKININKTYWGKDGEGKTTRNQSHEFVHCSIIHSPQRRWSSIKFFQNFNGQKVVECHYRSRPEETRHMRERSNAKNARHIHGDKGTWKKKLNGRLLNILNCSLSLGQIFSIILYH